MSSWRRTTDRDNRPWYAAPGGATIARDGFGRMCWTVYYPSHMRNGIPAYGMADTLGEVKAWGMLTCMECGNDQPTSDHRLCLECLEAQGDTCCEVRRA